MKKIYNIMVNNLKYVDKTNVTVYLLIVPVLLYCALQSVDIYLTNSNNIKKDTVVESASIIVQENYNTVNSNNTEDNEEITIKTEEETMKFIVDITDNFVDEDKLLVGNTSTETSYSGVIMIHISDNLDIHKQDIQVGRTYIVETEPMMTMSIPPHVTAICISEASDADILELEQIRASVSNFAECMLSYTDMELENIVADANMNYATWTQDEILKYLDYIDSKGYTQDMVTKSYVNTRENINGCYLYSE